MMDIVLASHPVDIYKACDTVFADQDWLSWEPETVLLGLKQEVSDAALDKLLAVQAVAANYEAALVGATAFEKVITAFCNGVCVMDVIQPPEVEEMSYAVSQIERLIKLVHGDVPVVFRGEVPGYTASVARFRGWFILPKNLAFAQEVLDSLTGLSEDTKKRKEYMHIVDEVRKLRDSLDRADAKALLEDPDIMELSKDTTASLIVKRHIGALLYDPTILYKNNDNAESTD